MVKRGLLPAFTLSALLLGAAGAFAADAAQADKTPSVAAPAAEAKAEAPGKPAKGKAAKPKPPVDARETLGDAFIAQSSLRVWLGRPAVISLHNARGQLLFHLESARPMEVLPLAGINAGYLYLTLRAGNLEMTKKLVYAGK